jgi:hypothetical protein
MNTAFWGWMFAWLISFSMHIVWLNPILRSQGYAAGACTVVCAKDQSEIVNKLCYCIDTAGVKTPKEIPKYPE